MILAGLYSPACAQGILTKNDSINILFIGNSYTYYNDMPRMIGEIASGIGVDNRFKVGYTAVTPGGYTFSRHLQRDEEIQAIKKGGWNFVILQEQSVAPSMPTNIVAESVYPFAHQLDSLIHVYNPDAKVIFYMTWGHKDGCQQKADNYPIVETYDGMQQRIITSYLEMTYDNNAWCAPVGMAWRQVREERPYLQLYTCDRSHPSKAGSYLAANVIFSTIFRHPYQSNYTAGLSTELAEYLQQVAQNTVFQNMKLLNIRQ